MTNIFSQISTAFTYAVACVRNPSKTEDASQELIDTKLKLTIACKLLTELQEVVKLSESRIPKLDFYDYVQTRFDLKLFPLTSTSSGDVNVYYSSRIHNCAPID